MNGRLARWGPYLLLAGAVALGWAHSLDAPFTYDDKIEVVGNPTLRALDRVDAIASYNTSRPLLILTYALNWRLGGLDPFGYHLVSVLIHAVNAGLAWSVLRRLGDARVALAAALLWAVHPMTTESVTYVTGRSDALCATFWLAATRSWLDHLDGRAGRAPTVAFAVAALLTKEVAVGLPVVLVGLAALRGRPTGWRTWAPFVAAVALAAAVRVGVYGWPAPEVARSALTQVHAQAEAWGLYLRLWLWPVGQSILHDHPARVGPAGWAWLAVWVAAGIAAWRRGGEDRLAFAWWAAVLLPSSVLPLKEVLAEHRSYLAGLPLVWLVVRRLPARPALALAVPLLVATVLRNEQWRSEVTLWRGATEVNPASPDAWYGYGDAARLARLLPEAEAAYRRVIELRPEDDDARVNLGIVQASLGRSDEARATWLDALRQNPRSCPAHNNLAALDLKLGRMREAANGYASALRWCPDDPIALAGLGDLFWIAGEHTRAIEHYRRYLARWPAGDHAERIQLRIGAALPR